MNMTAGSAYAIVLEGYGGKFGQYQLDVTADQVGCSLMLCHPHHALHPVQYCMRSYAAQRAMEPTPGQLLLA